MGGLQIHEEIRVGKKWSQEIEQRFGDVRLENNALISWIGELDEIEFLGELDENGRVERKELKKKLEEAILREEISWNRKVRTSTPLTTLVEGKPVVWFYIRKGI